jgi:hypothetical protein
MPVVPSFVAVLPLGWSSVGIGKLDLKGFTLLCINKLCTLLAGAAIGGGRKGAPVVDNTAMAEQPLVGVLKNSVLEVQSSP